MKELRDIIGAYNKASEAGKRTALATVVEIEGSSYRQPGARMLITEDGMLTGAISGGCLEGDALRKALLVIANNVPSLVTYDTSDDDDATIGVGLGCNGIIQILIEPIDANDERNPIALITGLLAKRKSAVLISLFSRIERKSPVSGTKYIVQDTSDEQTSPITAELKTAANKHLNNSVTVIEPLGSDNRFRVLYDVIHPPLCVVIVGAGNDVMPLVKITNTMGWETIVVDGRTSHATAARFPQATKVLLAKPATVTGIITTDERTVFLLMTHNYNYDLALLKQLVIEKTPYIGILGPRKKTDRMIAEIKAEHPLTEKQLSKIFGPVGLDTGAENAEEIALSICAEINAVMNKRSGKSLRLRTEPIHEKQNRVNS